MGGGDNELIIKTILDTTGFAKGSKQLTKAVNGLSSALKGMFGRIVGVASVFGVLSKAVSTYMSQNEQLSKQMNAAWTALGNALGPIINQLIAWVTQAISYLIYLMKLIGLTSKTASQASKAAKSAGGALQRTVAGFGELNKLSSGGGSGAGISISPIAFLSVSPDASVSIIPLSLDAKSGVDRISSIIERSPEIIDRIKKALS